MRFLLCCCLAGVLAACSTPAVRQVGVPAPGNDDRSFQIEARFSVTSENERYSGRLSWQHEASSDDLRIVSPFGQVVAEIEVRPDRASLLAADRQRHEAIDAQTLTRQVLGYPLPIERLAGWVRAYPAPSAMVTRDALGRPLLVVDEDWRVEYDYAEASPEALPARLLISRVGGPELLLRIEEWTLGTRREEERSHE